MPFRAAVWLIVALACAGHVARAQDRSPDGGASQSPGTAPSAPTVTFAAVSQPYTLARDSAAYVSANLDGPQMYPLRAGTPVMAVARSSDGQWIIVLTEDGQAAYLLVADLGPYDPSVAPRPETPRPEAPQPGAPQAQAPARSVVGSAQVVDTGTLIVSGQQLRLAGIEGERGIFAQQLQALIASGGGQVTCDPAGGGGAGGYVCRLPNGMDIARAALFNGAARIGDDASADYREQAESARTARRGIWR